MITSCHCEERPAGATKQSQLTCKWEIASGGFDTADDHRLLNHPRNDISNYFFFFPFSSSTRAKIMRPAAVCKTLVTTTSLYSPMYSCPFSTTTIVPSSM